MSGDLHEELGALMERDPAEVVTVTVGEIQRLVEQAATDAYRHIDEG